MKKVFLTMAEIFLAVAICVAVLLLARFTAKKTVDSALITNSRVLGQVFSEDSLDIAKVLSDESQRGLIEKFLAALTSAYVNFELIPYREGESLTAVLKSHIAGIEIEKFAYSGKNLIITGTSARMVSLEQFKENLETQNQFKEVSLIYTAEDGIVAFEIICYAKDSGNYQDLFPKGTLEKQ